jgi:hypothetical protein
MMLEKLSKIYGDLPPKNQVSCYNWKAKYAGMTVSDLRRLKALETENRRLKQIVAEQALESIESGKLKKEPPKEAFLICGFDF